MSLLGLYGAAVYGCGLQGGGDCSKCAEYNNCTLPLRRARTNDLDASRIPEDCPRLTWKRSECITCAAKNHCNFLKGQAGVSPCCRHMPDISRDCLACTKRTRCLSN